MQTTNLKPSPIYCDHGKITEGSNSIAKEAQLDLYSSSSSDSKQTSCELPR